MQRGAALVVLVLALLPQYPAGGTKQVKQNPNDGQKIGSSPAAVVEVPATPTPANANSADKGTARKDDPVRVAQPIAVTTNPDYAAWIFSALLVGVGGFQAYLLFKTMRAIQQQADHMKQQTAILEKNTAAAEANAEAAKANAEAALLSAKAIMGSERAWILVKPELPDGLRAAPQNQITRFRWSIKNVGRTPARILETDALAARIEKMKDFPAKPRYVGSPLSMNEFLLVPNDSIPITGMIEGDSLTEDEVTKIREGLSLHFAAYGYVKYLDVFDKPHTMRFCHRFVVYADTGKEGFEPYTDAPPEYNKCD